MLTALHDPNSPTIYPIGQLLGVVPTAPPSTALPPANANGVLFCERIAVCIVVEEDYRKC